MEEQIGKEVLDAAFKVHKVLGGGLLESAYEQAMTYELVSRGLRVETQVLVPVWYEGQKLENAFRADLIVGGQVLLELKSVREVIPAHKKQVLTYLRLSGMKLAYLINFGDKQLKSGISRIVTGLPEPAQKRFS